MRIAAQILALLALSSVVTRATSRVSFGHRGPITGIAIVGDSIFSCSHRGVMRQREPGKTLHIPPPPFRVVSIAPLPSGLLIAGGEPGESGKYAVMDLETGAVNAVREIAEDLIYSADATGTTGFFALADGRVLEIDLERAGDTALLHHEHTAPARAVRVSPNGRFLASGGMDRLVIVSDLERKSDRAVIQDHTGPVDCLVFSPDSTRVASGARDGKVRIHAVPGGKLIRTYRDLDGDVSAIAWGGKPERLLAGTGKGRIHELDLSNDSAAILEDRGEKFPIASLAIDSKGVAYAGVRYKVNAVEPPK